MKLKNNLTKTNSAKLLIAGLIVFVFLGLSQKANAYIGDFEISNLNIFKTSQIDFDMTSPQSNFAPSPNLLRPGGEVSREVVIDSKDSLNPVKYYSQYEYVSGDTYFCGELDLLIEYKWYDSNSLLHRDTKYSGKLDDFDNFDTNSPTHDPDMKFPNPHVYKLNSDYTDRQHWFEYTITVPSDLSYYYEGKTCNFNIRTTMWQDEFSDSSFGFSDEEIFSNELSADYWYGCNVGEEIFQIGDIEANQTDNPADEFNWPGAFGTFPPYDSPYIEWASDTSNFPYNSRYGVSADNFDIQFYMPGSTNAVVQLTLGWAPGASGTEQKEATVDGISLGKTPVRVGTSVGGWWNNYERFEDEFVFPITPGLHTLNLKQLSGNGAIWDYIKLEVVQCNLSCSSYPVWASGVENFVQGTTKGGSAVLTDRSDPASVLGIPDYPTAKSFISLGMGGSITVSFDIPIIGGCGNEISIYEVTGGDRFLYPEDKAQVEVSLDGIYWYTYATHATSYTPSGINYFNISESGLPWVNYVRVTDMTDYSLHLNDSDGFDIDAIDPANYMSRADFGLMSTDYGDEYNIKELVKEDEEDTVLESKEPVIEDESEEIPENKEVDDVDSSEGLRKVLIEVEQEPKIEEVSQEPQNDEEAKIEEVIEQEEPQDNTQEDTTINTQIDAIIEE